MSFADLIGAADRLIVQHLGGETVRCSQWGYEPWTDVRGMFTARHAVASAQDATVTAYVPSFHARIADLPADPDSDVELWVERAGVKYRVRAAEKDDGGGVTLLLAETD